MGLFLLSSFPLHNQRFLQADRGKEKGQGRRIQRLWHGGATWDGRTAGGVASPVLGSSEVEQGGEGRALQPGFEGLACNNIPCHLLQVPVCLWAAGPRFPHL